MRELPLQDIAWRSMPSLTEYTSIQDDLVTDVAIVGAGYTGLSTALHLAQLGLSVVVLEAEQPGWGASGRNAGAYLPPGIGKMPDQFTKLCPDDPQRAVDFIVESTRFLPRLIKDQQIDCDLKETGYLMVASNEQSLKGFETLAAAWNNAGASFDILDRESLSSFVASEAYDGALLFKESGSLNPRQYCQGLALAAQKNGASIFGGSAVTSIEPHDGGWLLRTRNASVKTRKVLIATNAYSDDLWPGLANSFVTITLTMLGSAPFKDGGKTYLPGGVPMMDDSATDMFGVNFNSDSRLICSQMTGSGSDGHRRVANAYWKKFLKAFPNAPKSMEWDYHWQGDISLAPDQFPKVSNLAPGAYAVTGYSGNGVAAATLLGKDLANVLDTGDDNACSLPIEPIKKIPFSKAISWAVQTTGALRQRFS